MPEPGDNIAPGGDTDPGDDTGQGEDAASDLDKVLDSLKRPRGAADDSSVSGDDPTRMSWNSVVESGTEHEAPGPQGAGPVDPSPSSFQFDLGSALERLGDPARHTQPTDHQPPSPPTTPPQHERAQQTPPPAPRPPAAQSPVPPQPFGSPGSSEPSGLRPPAASSPTGQEPELPRRRRSGDTPAGARSADAVSHAAPDAGPAAQLPRRDPGPTPERPVAQEAVPRRSGGASRSVFDQAAPAPSLPVTPPLTMFPENQAPVIPTAVARSLPTLPTVNPVPILTPDLSSAPAAPDIHAVRSYQLRAARERRRSKLAGHTFLAVVGLAGLVALALVFGRTYLFPDQWNAELTPVVDQIQQARDGEFSDVVELSVVPDDVYATNVLDIVVGPDWAGRLPEWRALGIASGDASSDALVAAVIAWRPAVYDPATDTILRAAGADPAALEPAYALALEEVFNRQQATPPQDPTGEPNLVLGVSPTPTINSRSIDRSLLGVAARSDAFPAQTPAPLPLLYEFSAVDQLGGPLLATGGDEVSDAAYGDIYPDSVLTATLVNTQRAVSSLPPDGTTSLSDPIALGDDAWAMIWQNRLPAATVDRLAALTTADSYRPVERAGTTCFVADFQSFSEQAATQTLAAIARWTLSAPDAATASVTLVAPTRVELFACDPGPAVEQQVDPTVVTAELDRQIARLAS